MSFLPLVKLWLWISVLATVAGWTLSALGELNCAGYAIFFGLAALLVLWFRRSHSVIDVWLMVVLCAWLFDIALSAIVNVARFDLGFYVGRIYGLCAASFVLAVPKAGGRT